MARKAQPRANPLVLVALGAVTAVMLWVAARSGAETPLQAGAAKKLPSVGITLQAGSPQSVSWGQFFACSGLKKDWNIARATLMLNDNPEVALWTPDEDRKEDIVIQLALTPSSQPLSPRAAAVADTLAGETCRAAP
jgi:hypothetical protein